MAGNFTTVLPGGVASDSSLGKILSSSNSSSLPEQGLGGLASPSNANAEVLRQIPNGGKKKKTGQKVERQSTEISQASGAATPGKVGRKIDRAITPDAYRQGQDVPDFDELINARTLGERPEDRIASLSVTLDFRDQINDPNNPFSGAQGNIISGYSRFFLTTVNEQQMEKYQIVETFSSYYVFFFGKRPTIYRYSGLLLNDENHKWTNDMTFFYDNYFRGTRTAEFNGHTIIDYDNKIVRGFVLGLNVQQDANIERGVPFSIDVLVLDHEVKKFSPDIKELIDNRTKELQQLREVINQQLSQINKNVPAKELLIAKRVGVGKALPSTMIPKAKADAAVKNAILSEPVSNVGSKVAPYGVGSIA